MNGSVEVEAMKTFFCSTQKFCNGEKLSQTNLLSTTYSMHRLRL
jgi:hypothetical protein